MFAGPGGDERGGRVVDKPLQNGITSKSNQNFV